MISIKWEILMMAPLIFITEKELQSLSEYQHACKIQLMISFSRFPKLKCSKPMPMPNITKIYLTQAQSKVSSHCTNFGYFHLKKQQKDMKIVPVKRRKETTIKLFIIFCDHAKVL